MHGVLKWINPWSVVEDDRDEPSGSVTEERYGNCRPHGEDPVSCG
jgi:hypothetical protein